MTLRTEICIYLGAREGSFAEQRSVSLFVKTNDLMGEIGCNRGSTGFTALDSIDANAFKLISSTVDDGASEGNLISHALILVAESSVRIWNVTGPANRSAAVLFDTPRLSLVWIDGDTIRLPKPFQLGLCMSEQGHARHEVGLLVRSDIGWLPWILTNHTGEVSSPSSVAVDQERETTLLVLVTELKDILQGIDSTGLGGSDDGNNGIESTLLGVVIGVKTVLKHVTEGSHIHASIVVNWNINDIVRTNADEC